jgi:hypothetical protein
MGAGPITVAEGMLIPARPDEAPGPSSGAGATTEACAKPTRRDVNVPWPIVPWPISGGGATIEVRPAGTVNLGCSMDANGTGGTRFEPIKFRRAAPFSFMSGAFRAAWVLSDFTRIGRWLELWLAV